MYVNAPPKPLLEHPPSLSFLLDFQTATDGASVRPKHREKGKEPGRVSFLLLGGRTLSSIPPKVTKVRPPHAAQFAGEAWIDCLWLSKFHLQNFLSVVTKYVFWRLVNFHVTHKARPKKNFPIAAAQANAVQAKSHNYLSKLNFTSYFPHFFFSPTRTAVHILSARARPDPQERELQLSLLSYEQLTELWRVEFELSLIRAHAKTNV